MDVIQSKLIKCRLPKLTSAYVAECYSSDNKHVAVTVKLSHRNNNPPVPICPSEIRTQKEEDYQCLDDRGIGFFATLTDIH